MRRGFGIITAIIIMMTVAILMSLMIGLSTATVKQTGDLYIRQKAEFLLRSTTEFALLAISGHQNSVDCVKSVTVHDGHLTGKADIWYIGKGITGCTQVLDNNIYTDASNLTAIIDVTVESDLTVSSEPIRLHRRTIQKP